MSRLAERIRNTEPWCMALLVAPELQFTASTVDLVAQEKNLRGQPFRAIWSPGFVVKHRVAFSHKGVAARPHDSILTIKALRSGHMLRLYNDLGRMIASKVVHEGEPLSGSVAVNPDVVEEIASLEGLSEGVVLNALERTSLLFLAQFSYTLTLLDCRNVRLEERRNPPKRRSKGKDKRQVESYWVLDIPGAPRYWERPASDPTGIQHRLHVVRGHFRTYTEERPHVSGWVGPMWISSHARGNAELGLVEKDYNLEVPQ